MFLQVQNGRRFWNFSASALLYKDLTDASSLSNLMSMAYPSCYYYCFTWRAVLATAMCVLSQTGRRSWCCSGNHLAKAGGPIPVMAQSPYGAGQRWQSQPGSYILPDHCSSRKACTVPAQPNNFMASQNHYGWKKPRETRPSSPVINPSLPCPLTMNLKHHMHVTLANFFCSIWNGTNKDNQLLKPILPAIQTFHQRHLTYIADISTHRQTCHIPQILDKAPNHTYPLTTQGWQPLF